MKLLMTLGSSGMLVGGLYAADVLTPGEIYDRPLPAVRAQLVAMDLPPMLLMASGSSEAARITVRSDETSVRWTLYNGSRPGAQFTAHLQPEGVGRTRVVLEQNSAASFSDHADQLTSARLMRRFAQTNFAERIDAQLEGRPFDHARAVNSFTQQITEHPEDVREFGGAVSGMLSDIGNQAAENMNPTTAEPSFDPRANMEAATRPSLQLPPSSNKGER